LNGKLSTKVRASIRRTSGTGWHGALYYQTNNGHSFEEGNKHVVGTDPTGGTSGTDWIIVEWDMANQSSGSTWTGSNTINQIRLDLGNSAADTFEVNWVAIGERGANALQEGATIQAGSAGGWTIEPDAIFTGTKDSSEYNDNNQVTLTKDGGIHAKKFYIDASDGSAHFKGAIEGGSIGGENTNAIPSTIFSRTVANSKGAPTGTETGGFIDLTTGDFVFGDASTFISFSPTSDDSNSPARKLTLKGDLEAENLTVTSSISTPLLKVGRLESGTVRVTDIREEVFSEIDSRLGNTGGYYASYETQVGNSDAGFKGEDATTTFTKELTNGGSGFAHAGETTFLNFALNDQFAAPVSLSTNTGAGRHPNDLKITAKFQKKVAGAADSTYVDVGSGEEFQLSETLIPYATRYTAEFSMSETITTGTGSASDPSNHVSGTSYIYRVVLAAVAQPGGSTYKSYFKTYYDSSGTLEGIGANDQEASPVFFEIREGSIGSSAGNLDTSQFITHTGNNTTNIEFPQDDQIRLNAGGQAMMTLTQNDSSTDTITLHKDTTVSTNLTVSGNATVTGNLTVDGTTTTLNTTNLNVQDKNILLANGSANKAASDGAGITVDLGTNDPVTPDASLTYAQATNDWLMNKNLRIVTGASTGTFQVGRDDTNQYLQLHVTDGNNTITAKQDTDENSAHSFILDRVFAGSGASDFHIRKDGTDQLIINKTGYVGIGTSTPKQLLHVQTTALSSDYAVSTYADLIIEDVDAMLEIVSNSDGTWGSTILLKEQNVVAGDNNDTIDVWAISRQTKRIGDGSGTNGKGDGSLRFNYGTSNDHNSGSPKVTFTNTGSVGIGTTDPQASLHISAGTSGDATIIIEADTDDNNEDDNPSIGFKQDGGHIESQIGHTSYGSANQNALKIANSVSSGGIEFLTGTTTGASNATSRMFIDTSGNVGIGTISPAAKLQVEDLGIETNSTSVSSTSATVVDTFAKATFRSARYTVQITQGTAYQCSDIMAIHDGTTAIGTEYAMIETGSVLGTLDVAINGDNVELSVTMAAADAATVKVVRHCVAV
jgi:hypothetical protein